MVDGWVLMMPAFASLGLVGMILADAIGISPPWIYLPVVVGIAPVIFMIAIGIYGFVEVAGT